MDDPSLSILETPRYRASEIAYLLAMPDSTVRSWCFGQSYLGTRGRSNRFAAVVAPADVRRKLLSFRNLCELHALAAVTRGFRIPLQRVREGLDYVSRRLGEPRPLATRAFLTDGLALFVDHASGLVNITRGGQLALRGEFERRLSRIEWDPAGSPVRLFPFTQTRRTEEQQPRVVAIDPRIAFGRPVLITAGVTTEIVANRFAAGDSPEEMANDYGIAEADIHEALRYEQRLRQERARPIAQRLAA